MMTDGLTPQRVAMNLLGDKLRIAVQVCSFVINDVPRNRVQVHPSPPNKTKAYVICKSFFFSEVQKWRTRKQQKSKNSAEIGYSGVRQKDAFGQPVDFRFLSQSGRNLEAKFMGAKDRSRPRAVMPHEQYAKRTW
jgi:hypothetical protein